MSRPQGLNNFAGTLEVQAGGPLDARTVVSSKSELIKRGNFAYPYVGMIVSVEIDKKAYMLTDLDYTNEDNWREVGESSQAAQMPIASSALLGEIRQYVGTDETFYKNGYFYKCIDAGDGTCKWQKINVQDQVTIPDTIVEGYFNPSNNLFYEESTYDTPIIGEDEVIYISVDTNKTYRYDSLNTIFIRLDKDEPDPIQRTGLPIPSVNNEGKIYQYVGATGNGLINGYFYECIEDPNIQGDYIWVQKNIQPDADTKIQVETLPVVTSADEGTIVQYIGETSGDVVNGYFYKCVEDEENPNTYIWEAVSVQAGGSGSGSLQKAITAVVNVGGIESGDNFAVGTNYDDMWDALLNPTLNPVLTDPDVTLSYGATTYYEVGTSIPAMSATLTFYPGEITLNGVKQNNRAGDVTNYSLSSLGADTEYDASSTSSGAFNVSALKKSSKGNIVLMASADFAAGPQPKDSKGNDYDSPLAAGTKTVTKTMQFILPYYYGRSSTTTVSSFDALSKTVVPKGQKQFKFTTNNEYMVIAYDSSYGNLSSILDPNGFETISGWTKFTLTVNGFSYYVYVANSATTDTNAQFTFKY